MFWCLVHISTGASSWGLYANPLEMAIQCAEACSDVKDEGLLVSWQLLEYVLVWVVSSSLAVEDGVLFFITGESFGFSVGQMWWGMLLFSSFFFCFFFFCELIFYFVSRSWLQQLIGTVSDNAYSGRILWSHPLWGINFVFVYSLRHAGLCSRHSSLLPWEQQLSTPLHPGQPCPSSQHR